MDVSGVTNAPSREQDGELAPTRLSLLERLRDMDNSGAWQEFFDTYWKLIYCAAIKQGLSDLEAEDVVQETVISAARSMEKFRYQPEACSFKGWLMHLTRCRVIDRIRKRRVEINGLDAFYGDPRTGTGSGDGGRAIPDDAAERAFAALWDGEWESNLLDAALERVKRKVKPGHYQIFHLRAVKGLPASDVGKILGASMAKVYVVRHRVSRLVKRELNKLMEAK
jgi:RNA polymerase sigma-70 factor (ECF subfamily)